MSFLLCHECYTWVEPADDRCPECQFVMDLSEADPPADILRELIGELFERLGPVRVPRRLLPEWGTLYATTKGLFFLPFLSDGELAASVCPASSHSFWQRFGALASSPIDFVSRVFRGESCQPPFDAFNHAATLSKQDDVDLAALLMEHPGTFFIPREQIRSIYQRRSRWTIERHQGGRLVFWPAKPSRLFRANFQKLLESAAWQGDLQPSRSRFLSFSGRTVSQS